MSVRVLIIDDNIEVGESIGQILKGALGIDVVTAADTASGIEAARNGFDVAVVDVKLPDGLGVDLIRPLLDLCPLAEVVIVTGYATVDTAVCALRAGAFSFLLKSFRPEELTLTVDQALRKVALKRERELLERRHRALVEGADVLIVGLLGDGTICLFNPRAGQLAGIPAQDAVGEPFVSRFIVASDREKFQTALRQAGEMDQAVEIEAGYLDTRGAAYRVRWHLSGVRGAGAAADLVYGIGLDVTERRALERRAADAEALATMGSLALGLAHEIRNPLNAGVLQLQLLSRDIARIDDAARRGTMQSRIKIIEGEVARLDRMLCDFLEFARPRDLREEIVDLGDLLTYALSGQVNAPAFEKIRVTSRLECSVTTSGDPEKLRLAFSNLLTNAIDAMGAGGSLCLDVYREPGWAVVQISDSGPGIDPAILPEIFAPFFTTKEAGTGLGLSIVRKIVDQHGGTLDISSEPGSGTRVRVKLPLEAGQATA